MHAMFEMDKGLSELKSILEALPSDSPHWNEAENRFKFIDRLLIEVLGWNRNYIKVENRKSDDSITDYELGNPTRAILEAKRQSSYFEFPNNVTKPKVYKLSGLTKFCDKLDAAVKQVITYCAFRGSQTAIICNGPQLIIFQAIVPGVSPLDGYAYVFNGFRTYIEYFPLLWSLLSPESVLENRAYKLISLHRNPRIPPKANTSISNLYQYRYRSSFQENLRALASILLEDIETHPRIKSEFYKQCYVPLEANNRHLLLSKKLIAARYARVTDEGSVPKKLDLSNSGTIIEINETILAESFASRPVVIIGDVGVGKTSFFENLREQANSEMTNEFMFIHINLGLSASLTKDIRIDVIDQITFQLKSEHSIDIYTKQFIESIYYKEIEEFNRGLYGDQKFKNEDLYYTKLLEHLESLSSRKDSHLKASLSHLGHGQGKQIILTIDNADQRDFETQQQAFLIAQELAATRSLLVFIALRPSTFFRSKAEGALSAYQTRVLTISPPPADEVLRKRIGFAVSVAEGKIALEVLQGIHLNLKNIVLFLKIVLKSIRENIEIRHFLSNITGGNTRQVIELFTNFCGSSNVESQKIVDIARVKGNYIVPLHEFTKHALLGDYAYFNDNSSQVAMNLFDIRFADPREHFLSMLIISYLVEGRKGWSDDGYLSGGAISQEMRKYEFLEDQVSHHLLKLSQKRLIETPHGHYREIDVSEDDTPLKFDYKVTSIGIYHKSIWAGSFAYLDAMSIDTPIFDDMVAQEINSRASSFKISDRLEKAESFRKYLEDQWVASEIQSELMNFTSILAAQNQSFETVKKVVERSGKRA